MLIGNLYFNNKFDLLAKFYFISNSTLLKASMKIKTGENIRKIHKMTILQIPPKTRLKQPFQLVQY